MLAFDLALLHIRQYLAAGAQLKMSNGTDAPAWPGTAAGLPFSSPPGRHRGFMGGRETEMMEGRDRGVSSNQGPIK
ncbi:hypothetical protein V5799_019050 [Amblyomma americanum]|uniref:Uncharacterized protein n=1 Tax=Amblyomma americanum TaxID=6943 RepID=A0AAQ4EY03_AMBAM